MVTVGYRVGAGGTPSSGAAAPDHGRLRGIVPFRSRQSVYPPCLSGSPDGAGHQDQAVLAHPCAHRTRASCPAHEPAGQLLGARSLPSGYNAVMERFFRSLKVESINRYRHQSQEELAWAVKKYIHFYNTQRIHSTIGSMSPAQYEQLFLKAA